MNKTNLKGPVKIVLRSYVLGGLSRIFCQTNWNTRYVESEKVTSRNVFGGFGGIVFEPNTSCRCSRSPPSPDNPLQITIVMIKMKMEMRMRKMEMEMRKMAMEMRKMEMEMRKIKTKMEIKTKIKMRKMEMVMTI